MKHDRASIMFREDKIFKVSFYTIVKKNDEEIKRKKKIMNMR